MPVAPWLMEMLICPDCHGKVGELEGGAGISCSKCGRVYPIRDGIPVMLIEESTPPKRPTNPTS